MCPEDTTAGAAPTPICSRTASSPDVCQPRVRRRLLSIGRAADDSGVVALAAARMSSRVATVADVDAAVDFLEGDKAACVVLDATDPRVDALSDVACLTGARPDVPVVVIGCEDDPARAVAVVAAGAQDYVLADGLDPVAFERALRHAIDRHRARVQLERLALHDQLTGVAGRVLFADRLDHALRRQGRAGGSVAVLFVDIDGFRRINDSLGHAAGDRALCAAAERIQAAVRPGDTVARIGGDEFTVLCDALPDRPAAVAIGERVAESLAQPLTVHDAEVVLRASVGVAITGGGSTSDQLVRDADQAMYQAKHRGGNRAEVFVPGGRSTINEVQTEAALRRAIPTDLRAHYQPQVRLSDGALLGMEALVRWEHPDRGLVSPGEFIPVAERSGLILPIGRWMLHEACREAVCLGDPAGGSAHVAVNVSGRQALDPALVDDVAAALAASGLAPERLQLELTESVLIQDIDAGVALMERLKGLGVSLALDDFGTGYSSLSYLKRFPFDVIKIDRSFVSGLPDCRQDLAIASAVISFAGALGMDVLAERVETQAHVEALIELGCDRAQGFHFHRPLERDALHALWRS